MDQDNFIRGTGALQSEHDPRTVKHENLVAMAAPLPISGGKVYVAGDIDDQHRVGICTAISFTQNRQKANGRKYSPDFQYLLQKKFFDGNWTEGSSIFNALKVGKTYGLLPAELFKDLTGKPYVTEADRYRSYDSYIALLRSIPLEEILRLLNLCTDKIAGYASVDVTDPQAVARAINDSQAGILCRYGCQKNWWTSITGQSSWQPKDIDPLRYGPETSGHAIGMIAWNYANDFINMLANTWGTMWDLLGLAHINWSNYKMNEAWTILLTAPVIPKFVFTKTLRAGDKGLDVKMLQTTLNKALGLHLIVDGNFGINTLKAVQQFQTVHFLVSDGVVGPKTNTALNLI